MQIEEIIFEEIPGVHGDIGLITLNRPAALNALNHKMFHALDHHFAEWGEKENIKAVVIRATPGRAFCAGGDIRLAYEKKKSNDPHLVDFFKDEYAMNRRLFHFKKPYIAILNGITMGGGAGISMHGSHRVGTPRMVFAMPETGIGFFPDIGASYFLSRLPFKMGFYLGITGETISYEDCYALKLVDQVIAVDSENNLLQKLVDSSLPDNETISNIIQQYSVTVPPSALMEHQNDVMRAFSKNSIEEIIKSLQSSENEWCRERAAIINKKSPISLKVTLEELTQAEHLNFDECMDMEYCIMQEFLNSHDFFEGIRAALIDKDRNPRWKPATLEEISHNDVMQFFSTSDSKEILRASHSG